MRGSISLGLLLFRSTTLPLRAQSLSALASGERTVTLASAGVAAWHAPSLCGPGRAAEGWPMIAGHIVAQSHCMLRHRCIHAADVRDYLERTRYIPGTKARDDERPQRLHTTQSYTSKKGHAHCGA